MKRRAGVLFVMLAIATAGPMIWNLAVLPIVNVVYKGIQVKKFMKECLKDLNEGETAILNNTDGTYNRLVSKVNGKLVVTK